MSGLTVNAPKSPSVGCGIDPKCKMMLRHLYGSPKQSSVMALTLDISGNAQCLERACLAHLPAHSAADSVLLHRSLYD